MVNRGLIAREKEDKKPKVIENPKTALILSGRKMSQTVREVLGAFHKIKAPHSVNLTKQKHDVLPFDQVADIEKLSKLKDTSLFFLGSHTKKRPNNLIIGRLFDHHMLDMIEFGVDNYRPMTASSTIANRYGSKPCILFKGDAFVNDERMQMVHNLLLDAFRGVEVRNINLLGLDHVIVCTALDTETVNVSHYAIEYKPTGEKAPAAELLEMGPFMDLKIRRTQFAAPDLRKKAMLTPDVLKKGVNHNKNLTRDALGNLEGRIHVTQQEIEQAALAKMPALQKRNKEAFAEQVRSDEASKELLENKRKFVADEMDVDEKPKKKSKK